MRPIGTAEELRRRRLRAVELVARGESPRDVARSLGCGRPSVSTRVELAEQAPEKLAAGPHPGPKPRLRAAQLEEPEGLLRQGAEAHGRRTGLWTAARVAALIERHFEVRLHPEHVRKLLERRPRRTSRGPRKRAKERDEAAIERRRRVEPPKIVRRASRRGAPPVPLDESGSMPTPAVRRTPAPRGEAAILDSRDRHDRISAIGAIAVSPTRRRVGLHFRLLPDDVDVRGPDVVAPLRELRRELPVPMTALRDRGNVHDRSEVVRADLAERPPIETEPLPGYTPEADPGEGVWEHTERGRLADFAPEGAGELRAAPVEERERLARRPDPLASFIRHAKIPIRLRM